MDFQTLLAAGLVLAFVALLALAVTVRGYGEKLRALPKSQNGGPSEEKESQAAEHVLPAVEEGIPGEVVAAIAAAVACVLPGARIASVRRAARPARSAWSMAGLLENTKPF